MGRVRVKGTRLVAQRLQNIGEATTHDTRVVLREGAKALVELAQRYAPVDEGALESAIKDDESRTGINGRMVIEVGVDDSVTASDGRSVGRYALIMHEALAPYGSGGFNLGPLSRKKAGAGNDVGGKFLERAAVEIAPEIKRELEKAIKKALKKR